MLGSLGIPELLFIFGLALLVFGPKRLPEVGRALGRGMAELRKASNDLKRTINAEMIEQEMRDHDPRRMVRDSLRDVKKSLTVDLSEPAPAKDSEQTATAAKESNEKGDRSAADGSDAASLAAPGSVARGSGRTSSSIEDPAIVDPEDEDSADAPAERERGGGTS